MTLKKFLHLNIMTEEMHNIEIPQKNKSLSLFHINACSLNKNFDDLHHLLSCTKTNFDIIAISETRITKQVSFNVNLLNYNEHNQTNEFLDSLASNSFIPLILQPTRITSHSNTLKDNIFSNVTDPDMISGNLTATISDHLPQFSIICLAISQAINLISMNGTGPNLI